MRLEIRWTSFGVTEAEGRVGDEDEEEETEKDDTRRLWKGHIALGSAAGQKLGNRLILGRP